MEITMIYPDPKSEKGVSHYSIEISKYLRKQGVDVQEMTYIHGKSSTLFKRLKEIKKNQIVHIQHEYNILGFFGLPFFILYWYLNLFKKAKIVTTMHTVISKKEKLLGSKIKTFLRKILYLAQNKVLDSNSKKIIVHSQSFKEILVNEYSISENKVQVRPIPIWEDIKTFSKKESRKKLNLSGNVYLMIGVMGPMHGHDIIIRQADKIGKTILIVSNPTAVNDRNIKRITDFLKLNQDIVKNNHFEKYVRFDLGFIDYEKWWQYFSAADLVLMPYRWCSGSSIFADAMAMQKPVIASNIPYFRDFAQNYGCIRIAKDNSDFPNQIKEAMKPKNYQKMLKDCKRFFDENNLTAISKKYKTLYKSL